MEAALQQGAALPVKKERIHFIDEVRGLALICVLVYHTLFTLSELFGLQWAHALLLFFRPLEPYCGGLFIFISGISSDLSRSNLKRGASLLFVALGVTFVTAVVVPQEVILFGILHFLSLSMLCYGLIGKTIQKLPLWVGLGACTVLFFACYSFPRGLAFFSLPLPQWITDTYFLFPLGICAPGFTSADYYPLLPWIFVFLAGGLVGRFAAAGKFPRWMYRRRVPLFSWIGRHALLLYLVQQPLLYGIGMLVSSLL